MSPSQSSELFPKDLKEANLIDQTSKLAALGGCIGAVQATTVSWWMEGISKRIFHHVPHQAFKFGTFDLIIAGISAFYGAGCIIAAKQRNVNDEYNYGIGGGIAGFVLGSLSTGFLTLEKGLGAGLFHGATLGTLSLITAFWLLQKEKEKKPFFAIPRPDPYKRVFDEITK